MFLAHPASGLTTTYLARKAWDREEYTPGQRGIFYSVGIITAFLPDVDILYAAVRGLENHREYITHTPIFYILVVSFLFLFSFIIKPKIRKYARSFAMISLFAFASHILTDALGGVMLLFYPLSHDSFTLFSVEPVIKVGNNICNYLLTPLFGLTEFFFTTSAIYILARRMDKRIDRKIVFWILLISSIISFGSTALFILIL